MSLRDHLDSIRQEKGELTPQTVVDSARPASHPLHSRFEWNNKVAGEAYRRVQARELIRSVMVRYGEPSETEEAKSVRAFVAVPSPEGSSYQPVEDVAQDEFSRELVLRDMEREWKALHRRYSAFKEFAEMVRATIEAA